MKKIKTYRMSISRVFPAKHPRAGEKTYFYAQIQNALFPGTEMSMKDGMAKKLHTIRENYELWKKRIDEVNTGNAVLVLYEWADKPFRSKTRELFIFDKDSGISVQKITLGFIDDIASVEEVENEKANYYNINIIAENDGLSEQDFRDWFKGYDLSAPKAIIQFTKFRY